MRSAKKPIGKAKGSAIAPALTKLGTGVHSNDRGLDNLTLEDDTFPGCPNCKTTFAMVPNLKIVYSTCCGLKRCTNCVHSEFQRSRTFVCPSCSTVVLERDFTPDTIDTQFYKAEKKTRRENQKIFVLQRDDFDTLDQYNDYLEFAEDMVEILTYGSEQEKTASRLKLAEYEKTYHDRITRRTLAKDVQRRRDQEGVTTGPRVELDTSGNAYMAGVDGQGGPGAMPLAPPRRPTLQFALPKVLSETAPSASKAAARPSEQRDEALRLAGGFQFEHHRQRSKQEALAGLFHSLRLQTRPQLAVVK